MGRRLVIGDIHGSYRALMRVFEKAAVGYDDDVFFVGDISDGYPETLECLRLFYSMRNFHAVIGNHDLWLMNYLSTREAPLHWLSQGGNHTVESIDKAPKRERLMYAEFLASWPYVLESGDDLIMHGGPSTFSVEELHEIASIKRHTYEEKDRTSPGYRIVWDRDYFYNTLEGRQKHLEKRIITGHTPVKNRPYVSKDGMLINLDTGAGFNGPLTMMDIDSMEIFQSNGSDTYYPGFIPRPGMEKHISEIINFEENLF